MIFCYQNRSCYSPFCDVQFLDPCCFPLLTLTGSFLERTEENNCRNFCVQSACLWRRWCDQIDGCFASAFRCTCSGKQLCAISLGCTSREKNVSSQPIARDKNAKCSKNGLLSQVYYAHFLDYDPVVPLRFWTRPKVVCLYGPIGASNQGQRNHRDVIAASPGYH